MADGILSFCSVARGSGIITLNSLLGSTLQCGTWLWDDICHWNRPNVRHIGILLPISMSTISPQSTCPSAPVCEILSKLDRQRRKMTSCRFSGWRISAILDFWGSIMGSLKRPSTTSYRSTIETTALNCLVFFWRKSRFFAFWWQDPRWRISAILDFRGLIIGSLKSPCATSYRGFVYSVDSV